MKHESAEKRIDAYLDNELDASDAIALLEHIGECSQCTNEMEASSALRDRIRKEMLRYQAPSEFKAKLTRDIRKQRPSRWRSSTGVRASRVFSILGVLAIGILAGVLIDAKLIAPSAATGAIFAEHINSLKSGHLIDVASSDKHTVKPWFAGKVDFSPFVIDLSTSGYPLLGGRYESFDGHDAAALVYAKGHHYIELYEWPVQRPLEAAKEERGYNALFFVHGGMQCCVISDAALEEITVFHERLEGALMAH